MGFERVSRMDTKLSNKFRMLGGKQITQASCHKAFESGR